MLCNAAASKRGEDEEDDVNSDTMPDERYHAPDLYKPSSSLVERAVHRVEQNLEKVMQADLKRIEQRVMAKVNKVQAKQMHRIQEMQEAETLKSKFDKFDPQPQGASELESEDKLVPETDVPDDTDAAS